MMNLRNIQLVALAALFVVFHGARAETGGAPVDSPPYIRVVEDPTNGAVQLQFARRCLVPATGTGTRVWLVGTSHMGLKKFYSDTQSFLDPIPLVLYEDVGAANPHATNSTEAETAYQAGRRRALAAFPKFARTHGLVSQAESIHYQRPNFEFCDLTPNQVEELLTKSMGRAPSVGMANTSSHAASPVPEQPDAATMAVLNKLARVPGSQMMMARLFMMESSKGDVVSKDAPGMEGFNAVIIDRRNAVLLDRLQKRLQASTPVTGLAVFYGAGHLPFLERQLCELQHYKLSSEEWLTAVAVAPADLQLSVEEFRLLRTFVANQVASQRMGMKQP